MGRGRGGRWMEGWMGLTLGREDLNLSVKGVSYVDWVIYI